ncbi:alpha/beta hydrolase [Spongisporangium articulatum]|uniref:Alpha/beta hydrolase n=1 Tax=Spongisporangium articulatum TaxID=3362603 RepID=A0ABW8AJY4_9ACTN
MRSRSRGRHRAAAAALSAAFVVQAVLLGWAGTPARADVSASLPGLSVTLAKAGMQAYGGQAKQQYSTWIPAQPTTDMAVVTVHGGSWIYGDATKMYAFNRKLYAAGIPSFSIDYRSAFDAEWPAQRTDLLTALAQIRSQAPQYGIDPAKIALIGSSAGGQIALSVASSEGRKVSCAAVAYSPPTSLRYALNLRRTGVTTEQKALSTGARWLTPTKAQVASATVPKSPSKADTPALLFAGADEWLSFRNSTRYVQAYAGKGLDVRAVVLKGEQRHASAYAAKSASVWKQTLAFIDRHC